MIELPPNFRDWSRNRIIFLLEEYRTILRERTLKDLEARALYSIWVTALREELERRDRLAL